MKDLYWEITLSALLHDVGKIGQRAFERDGGLSEQSLRMKEQLCPFNRQGGFHTHLHVLYTNEFFNQTQIALPASLNRGALVNFAVRHHKPEQNDESLLIAEADRLASGMERIERTADDEPREDYRETQLVPITTSLQLAEQERPKSAYGHTLSQLHADLRVLFPVLEQKESLRSGYRDLWEELIRRSRDYSFQEVEALTAQLLNDLADLAWCVPSATNVVPDISLFDHSRAVAAIAGCLYRSRISNPNVSSPFILVAGDFAGIQTFIYDLQHGSGAFAKTLRARSFIVGLFGELASLNILQKANIGIAHRLLSAGGRMYLLLPNDEATNSVLNQTAETLDRWSLEATDGELRYALAQLQLTSNEIMKFGRALQSINQLLDLEKRRPLRSALSNHDGWNQEVFLRPSIEPNEDEAICDGCKKATGRRKEIRGRTKYLCESCWSQRELGQRLTNAQGIVLSRDPLRTGYTLPFFDCRLIKDSEEDATGNSFIIRWGGGGKIHRGIPIWQQRALYVPKDREGELLEFEEIAALSTGRRALGYVKADVDNLGLIFSLGLLNHSKPHEDPENLRRNSISRIASLSRTLEQFFAGYVQQLVQTEFPYMYLVYSGGDDLLAVGPWDQALEFTVRLRKDFASFTGDNPSVGLSAGVLVTNAGTPLLEAVEQADDALECSKKTPLKNSVTVLGHTMDWRDAEDALTTGKILTAWLKDGILTTSKVRRLLIYARMHEEYRRNPADTSQLRYIPRLVYDLKRNWKESKDQPASYTAREWAQQFTDPSYKGLPALTLACEYCLYASRNIQGGE